MNDQPSAPTKNIDHAKCRLWTRLPPEQRETSVIVQDERKTATVCDESFGGIGLTMAMADAVNVQVGDPLVVLYYDYPTPGRVQWIDRDQEAQRVRLGIRWSS
jgi:hypothetical protein